MILGLLFPDVLGKLLQYGGPGLTALGIVSSFIPIPGGLDVATILLAANNPERWWYYALLALAGDVIGAYLNYRVSREGGKEAVQKKISRQKAQKAFAKFEQYGGWGLLIGAWMPPPMPWIPFMAAAGALKYPIRKFMSVVAVGRGARFFVVAWVGHRYGDWITSAIFSYQREILYALIVLGIVIGIGVLLYFKWYRPRQERKQEEEQQPLHEDPQSSSASRSHHEPEPGRKAG